jgi:hypothetical protein
MRRGRNPLPGVYILHWLACTHAASDSLCDDAWKQIYEERWMKRRRSANLPRFVMFIICPFKDVASFETFPIAHGLWENIFTNPYQFGARMLQSTSSTIHV